MDIEAQRGGRHPQIKDSYMISQKRICGSKGRVQSEIRNQINGISAKKERAFSVVKRQRVTLIEGLMNDYALNIQEHLKKLESEVCQEAFLGNHQISSEYRAKMIDWMAEVLQTFKASDQTFFLAVNIMDRYFKNCEKQMKASDLHLVGIVSMFIASKYEDVIPLLMKTIVNKIGHNKFSQQVI